jgi:transmembrane sensor
MVRTGMDEVILRSFRDKLSTLEERRLQNWRRASAENEEHYQQLARLWQIAPQTLPAGESPARPQLGAILARANRVGTTAVSPSPSLHNRMLVRHGRWLRRSAAAAAVLLLGIGVVWSWSAVSWSPAFGVREFATGSAQTVTVTLADGSFVRLAPNSHLRLPPGGEKRQVWLDGRAYFAVRSDSAHPFTVHTSVGEARVLGTRFELRVEGDDLRLAVVEGHVKLSAADSTVAVGAGEVSRVKEGTAPSVIKVKDVNQLLDWPDGLLIFQSTPLNEVRVALERHFDVRVNITDSVVAQRVVTGWFAEESLDEVLTAVCRATRAHCSIDGERVVISP